MADVSKPRGGFRRLASRMLKVLIWIVGIIMVLALVAMCAVAWILTPATLTPLVRSQAGKFLDADVGLGRIELTVWSSFPRLMVEVDSLSLRSREFDGLPADIRSGLPVGADTLLFMGHFRGALDVPALLTGTVSLSDLSIARSRVNIVVLDSVTANFNIVESDTVADKDAGSDGVFVPDIRINRFEIVDSLPVSYRSLPDSVDFRVVLSKSPLLSSVDGGYRVSMNAGVGMSVPPELRYDLLDVALDGDIEWSRACPEQLAIRGFKVGIGALHPVIDASVDFSEPLTLDSFGLSLENVSPADILSVLPDSYRESIGVVEGNASIGLRVDMTEPYVVADSLLPSFDVKVSVPSCHVAYDRKFRLERFALDCSLHLPRCDIAGAVVDVSRFDASAGWIDINVDGLFKDLMADPSVDATVKASADFGRMPREIMSLLPGRISGSLDFDSKVRMRMSDLDMEKFHRIFLDGRLAVDDVKFVMADSSLTLYAGGAEFRLGTNTSFVTDSQKVDSLLTASVKVDTLAMAYGGTDIRAKDISVGAGCLNKPRGADSTVVMPFGGRLRVGMLSYVDSDSLTLRLRDVAWNAMLRRYEGLRDVPHLQLYGDIGRSFFTDRSNYLMLHDGHVDVSAHLRRRSAVPARIKARYDSIVAHNPGISPDSVMALMRARHGVYSRRDSADYDRLNLDLGNDAKRLLRRWNVSGHISAGRGGAFTPYFPIRNRISHFDVAFSTDSVVLNDIRYDAGRSGLVINGAVRGLNRAIMRGAPLQVDIDVKADTLNVNELVQAAYVGAAYSGASGMDDPVDAPMDSSELDRLADAANASDTIGALLVPMNLMANVRIGADPIIYSDMLMRDFNGLLMVNRGVVTLRDLSARSDIGSASMTALYMAPTKNDIHFGMGLKLDGIKVKEFIGMIPAVDSLMPLLGSFEGIINADVVATSDIDSTMNIIMPSLDAAVKLSGSDLVLLDAETFRTMAKWLMFKDKKISGNKIDDMAVELVIRNSTVELFPFVFDFDRYRLAVMGSNDLNLNYKYHVSVLKSPLPFKFGINISGNADDMKIRLGGAKYKPGKVGERMAIVDTTRVNLMKEIDRVFQRGAKAARLGALEVVPAPDAVDLDAPSDTISAQDSLLFIKEGLIEAPLDSARIVDIE